MAKSLAEILQQFRAILQTMSAGKLMTLFVMLAATVAGLIVLVSWSGEPDYMPLYNQMPADEAGEVIAILKERKIEYKLSNDGSTIQIPREKLYEVRLDLASQGLPRGGSIGFEVFDNAKLGMTEFVQNINYQRALQGELSRTINGFDEIENSRVHLVMPPRSLFIEKEESASASVIIQLRKGRWLNKDQIQGIVHLVSSSVPRLSPENITLVDQNGELLAGSKDQESASKMSGEYQEIQQQKEKSLEQRVSSMLEQVLGLNKAIVRVSCDLDFIQQEKTEELYLPDNQVVRSEQLLNEISTQKDQAAAGIPGLATNLTADSGNNATSTAANGFKKEDNTRNYEIGKTTSKQIMPVGQLKRLSVAVIVDGSYKKEMVGTGEDQHEEQVYVQRTVDEIAALETIVKRAVNFDETRGDKVEVANIAFNTEKLIEQEKAGALAWLDRLSPYNGIVKYVAAGLFIIFSFLFIIRPITRWLTDTSWEDVDLLEYLPRTVAELEQQYGIKKQGPDLVNQAAQLISVNQEESSRLMKQWLSET